MSDLRYGPGPLAAAQCDLEERAEAAGDWDERQVLVQLADVADYTRRICLDGASAHYRAAKAAELLRAAIQVQRHALMVFAASPPEGLTEKEIDAAFDLLQEVAAALVGVGWGVARRAPVYRSQASVVGLAAERLSHLAASLVLTAEPDDE